MVDFIQFRVKLGGGEVLKMSNKWLCAMPQAMVVIICEAQLHRNRFWGTNHHKKLLFPFQFQPFFRCV